MKKSIATFILCAGCLTSMFAMSGPTITAQETTKASASQKKVDKPKSRNRLPNYYGKLGLSTEQRTKIYGVQADAREKIEALQNQMATLKEKATTDIHDVLTQEQQRTLAMLLDEASKKRAERLKKKKVSSGS
jgi:hypothetical protein